MSSLPADLLIWGLLFVATVFCGIGLMGLMIFPDTRSRMFTAFRATMIGLGAAVLSVIVYGSALFSLTGNDQYIALIVRTLFLMLVLAAGTWGLYGIIRDRTKWQKPGSMENTPDVSEDAKKDGN